MENLKTQLTELLAELNSIQPDEAYMRLENILSDLWPLTLADGEDYGQYVKQHRRNAGDL
jgi:hypothetical protein